MKRLSTVLLGVILLLSLFPSVVEVRAEQPYPQDSTQVHQTAEDRDRLVGRAALDAQAKAISSTEKLLKKYRGNRQEPILLLRLAEMHQQNASVHFRIAHATAHTRKKPVDLSEYKKQMNRSIQLIDRLLAVSPRFDEAHRAYYMRGKAYQEIGKIQKSKSDFLHLVRNYDHAPEAVSAYMALAEFAIEANQHAEAIQHLEAVEAREDSPFFPFALYKLGWSHYNLKNIPKALKYLERNIAFYRSLASQDDGLASTDQSMHDRSFQDLALFYFEGYETKQSGFGISEAYSYFKGLNAEMALGSIFVRFAQLLRSRGFDSDLISWKNLLIQKELQLPETIDVTIIAFEHLLNRRDYAKISETAKDFVTLYTKNLPKILEYESYTKAQKILLDTAKEYQVLTVKNKKSTRVSELTSTLAVVYDTFTKIVNENDPRVPGARYNLAETLFEIQDYSGSTHHYRWVVENWKDRKIYLDAEIKSIASRYEELRLKKLIPTEVIAIHLKEDSSREVEPLLREWVTWVDMYRPAVSKSGQPDEVYENFRFEAARSLYSQKRVSESIERLIDLATTHPRSKFAVPAASLALDTYVTSQKWDASHDLARDFLKIKTWFDPAFSKTVFGIAADSFYKLVEIRFQSGDYTETLAMVSDCEKLYPSSPRFPDCLFLGGRAAVSLSMGDEAEPLFSKLIKEYPKSPNIQAAVLSRARIREEAYRFADSAADYLRYLESSHEKSRDLKVKLLYLQWLSGSYPALRKSIDSKAICDEKMATDCERYEAALAVEQHGTVNASEAYARSRKSSGEIRSIWAAAALESSEDLSFRDRLLAVRILVENWNKIDPTFQLGLLPKISRSIPNVFRMNRMRISEVSPLRANERYLADRIQKMKDIEVAATRAMELPWSQIKALVLYELGEVYGDFARGLMELKAPGGLSDAELAEYNDTIRKILIPFEDKGQTILSEAFKGASDWVVDTKTHRIISDGFFRNNASQAKTLRTEFSPPALHDLGLGMLKTHGEREWHHATGQARHLRDRWTDAIRQENWALAAFFLQEMKDRKSFSEGTQVLMKTATLKLIGAQGEALAHLHENLNELSDDVRLRLSVALVGYALDTMSKPRIQDWIKNIPGPLHQAIKTSADAFILAYSAHFAGVSLHPIQEGSLLDDATGVSKREEVAWIRQRLSDLEPARKVASAK